MASETVTDMKGNVVKMEADYSQTVDKALPECEKLVKEGKLQDALDNLLTLEKQTRTMVTRSKLEELDRALAQLPNSMRLFSLSMRSLYEGNAIDTSTTAGVQLQRMRDLTRSDAVGYLDNVLPKTEECVSSIKDQFLLYEAFSYETWYTNLDSIIEETSRQKEACKILINIHEVIMIRLKQRQEDISVLLLKMRDLASRYKRAKEQLEREAKVAKRWAIALAFIPIVNIIATHLLADKVNKKKIEAITKSSQLDKNDQTALVISDVLVPALGNFLDSLRQLTGFLELTHHSLMSFKATNSAGRSNMSNFHYLIMKEKAKKIKSDCSMFYAVLPDVRTDFAALPRIGIGIEPADEWLSQQNSSVTRYYAPYHASAPTTTTTSEWSNPTMFRLSSVTSIATTYYQAEVIASVHAQHSGSNQMSYCCPSATDNASMPQDAHCRMVETAYTSTTRLAEAGVADGIHHRRPPAKIYSSLTNVVETADIQYPQMLESQPHANTSKFSLIIAVILLVVGVFILFASSASPFST